MPKAAQRKRTVRRYESYDDYSIQVKAVLAEFVGMTLFIFASIGVAVTVSAPPDFNFQLAADQKDGIVNGQAMTETDMLKDVQHTLLIQPAYAVVTPLVFGFSILALAYATGHTSGGQFNSAVTIGLFAAGVVGPVQAAANIAAQWLGSLVGAGLVYAMLPNASDAPNIGANELLPGVTQGNAMVGEVVMTFLLMFVVLETTVNHRQIAGANAAIAIGLCVFLGNAVLIPIDNAQINPARSFGPAVVSGKWDDFWIFMFGPIGGALLAVGFHVFFRSDWDSKFLEASKEKDEIKIQEVAAGTNMEVAKVTVRSMDSDALTGGESFNTRPSIGSP